MKKIDMGNGKGLKLLAVVVAMCALLGLLAGNSLKILSVSYIAKNNASKREALSKVLPQAVVNIIVPENPGNDTPVTPAPAPDTTAAPAPTAAPTTAAPAPTAAPATTAAPAETKAPEGTNAPTEAPTQAPTEATTAAPTTTQAPTTTEPVTDSPKVAAEKKAILTKYKTVVNTANSRKAGFTKAEYRTLGGSDIAKTLLTRIQRDNASYFVTESAAKASPEVVAKGADHSSFLIPQPKYGCILPLGKASDAIESATEEKLDDGTVKITIVLRDEKEPALTPVDTFTPESFTSAFFTIPECSEVKSKVATSLDVGVKIFERNTSDIVFSGCTAELIYNPITGRIISLKQTVNYGADVNYNLFGLLDRGSKVTVTDISEYTDFVY